jgi:SAM-dependent methyltransferase
MNKHGGYVDQPILAELYDLVPGYAKRTDINFYLQYCVTASGSILELGCGTGRILLPAAESGCRITGLDTSPHMLTQCQQKLKRKSPSVQSRVRLVQGDMTNFDLAESFHLVTVPFRAFLHVIAVDDQLACLKRIYRHLTPGGCLIIDVFQVDLKRITNPRATEESEDFAKYELPDGRRLRRTSRIAAFHPADQVNDVEMIYHLTNLDGTTERIVQAFPFRYIFRYEMEHLLARCGFKVVDLFGNFDKSPLADNSPEMIFVAEKCENLD